MQKLILILSFSFLCSYYYVLIISSFYFYPWTDWRWLPVMTVSNLQFYNLLGSFSATECWQWSHALIKDIYYVWQDIWLIYEVTHQLTFKVWWRFPLFASFKKKEWILKHILASDHIRNFTKTKLLPAVLLIKCLFDQRVCTPHTVLQLLLM